MSKDTYQIKKLLNTRNGAFTYYSLAELEKQGHGINRKSILTQHRQEL